MSEVWNLAPLTKIFGVLLLLISTSAVSIYLGVLEGFRNLPRILNSFLIQTTTNSGKRARVTVTVNDFDSFGSRYRLRDFRNEDKER